MPQFLRRALLAGLASLAVAPLTCLAQSDYPSQPIKVIVPFPPAGGTDVVTRLLTDKLRVSTGWSLVVDNRPGAGGNIGMDLVAKARADGYTLGMGQTANLAINPSLYPKMPYDATKDVVPVALIAGQPMVLVVGGDARFKTLADLVAAAKARPASLTMGSAGNGTVGHLTGEIFAKQAGFKFLHVPYRGAAPALTDLLGGQVDFYLATPQSVVSLVKTGKLRALAVSSAKRLPVMPETPTIAESGYKGFESNDWKLLVAPAGTAASIVNRLNAEADKVMSSPATLAQLLAEGSVPMSGSPQQVAAFLKSEQLRWGAAVRDANVKIE